MYEVCIRGREGGTGWWRGLMCDGHVGGGGTVAPTADLRLLPSRDRKSTIQKTKGETTT